MPAPRREPAPRGAGEKGSTLVLVPAAVLVLLILAALAIDSAVTFLGQRQLASACFDAANDAATLALDPRVAAGSNAGPAAIDQGVAQSVGDAAAARLNHNYMVNAHCYASVDAQGAVHMHGVADVRLVFAPALPGRRLTTHVDVQVVAAPMQR